MEVVIQRQWYTDKSVCGQLTLDGVFQCYTLEPPNQPFKPRAIPPGTYSAQKFNSPHFGIKTILFFNVPDFTAVEIHPGNFPHDTRGCTVVGSTHEDDFVGNSRATFEALMAKLPDEFQITFIGGLPEG